ncbi:hypothetical protein [Ensifer adhaerens]|uniref:Uncharacterized protein n=1 Tax=Ensifer adhaerens TaxID=106592 RepID=A0A9Q9DEA6_ENSAD|nr:hypothetical protein [Ensifer adhaerens]USJ28538.1 hypothetical protein NE863_36055 [Ensifer adhaerens]
MLISRLLSILAILGLLTAPMATPSAAEAMAGASMVGTMDMGAMPDDMSCCPDQKQSLPSCQKSCPLATICMAKCVPGVAQREFALFRLDRAVKVDPYKDRMRDPTIGTPPDRPPRT